MIIKQREKGAVEAQVVVAFENEKKTFSDLLENETKELSRTATLAATGLFELLGCQGTNTFFFEEPVRAEVLARKEHDGWSPAWPQKRADPNELESIAEKIRFALPVDDEQTTQQKTPSRTVLDTKNTTSTARKFDDEESESLKQAEEVENYMIRQLYRIP